MFPFLFLKFMIKYLKQIYHTWDTWLIILIDILLSKRYEEKSSNNFLFNKTLGKKDSFSAFMHHKYMSCSKNFHKASLSYSSTAFTFARNYKCLGSIVFGFMKSNRRYMHIANQNAKKYRNGFMDCLKKESNNCCDIKLINVL